MTLLMAHTKSIASSSRTIMIKGLGRIWMDATVVCWPSIILEGQRNVTKICS